jgi:hypothetical protein
MKGWSGTLEAAVASASSAATAAQATAEQALDDASIVWVDGGTYALAGPSIISPVSLPIVAPVTGTLEVVALAPNIATNQTVTFTTTIGGVTVTGGSVSYLSTDPAQVVKSSVATANHAVVGLSSVVIVSASTTSTSSGLRLTVALGFRRA